MNLHNLISIAGLNFLVATSSIAAEYVPPPTGPYQPSVVINKNGLQAGNGNKVYKFPTADFIQGAATRGLQPPDEVSRNYATANEDESRVTKSRPQTPMSTDAEQSIAHPRGSVPAGNFAANPWAIKPQQRNYPAQQNWNIPAYPSPQYYPYGYYNQQNSMNNPFNGMPSPWSVMPMQPFFSGR